MFLRSVTYFQLMHIHSSRFLLRYDYAKQPYHFRDEISIDGGKSNRLGSSLGAVTPAFMVENIRLCTSTVALSGRR